MFTRFIFNNDFLITALKNLQNTQGNITGGGEQSNNTVQPRGDILSALTQNTLVQELTVIVTKQVSGKKS